MDKRTLLAVALSLAVLLGWSYFFRPEPVVQQPVLSEQKTSPNATEVPTQPSTTPEAQMPVEDTAATDAVGSDVTVETDLFKAVFSTEGAVLKYWELKNFNPDKTSVTLLKEPGAIPPLSLIFEGPNSNLPRKFIYTSNTDKLTLSEHGNKEGELIFTYSGQGMTIKKKLIFYNNDYKINLSIETVNTPSYMLPVGTNFGIHDREQKEHKGPVMLIASDREEFDDGLKSPQQFTGNIDWIAQEDKYFTAAIIPVNAVEGINVWKEKETAEIALKLKSQQNDFILYAGPKEYDRLKQLNAKLEYIIDFGWFAFVAMPLFYVLKFFYGFMGNYGWAIITLTVITRIPFIPLLHKSQQSMKKMQKIQPMMAELKEKYKNDAAKMQKETMALYKKHKVNPVGGCLPMLLQIPVFIALYNVLLRAIELRGAPFIFWITDLAAKDPYYVLPIVMGLTMVLQQKMTPTAMDPKQAKIMMLMPIVFTFMFLSFASGLVLYWLVNNILGIAQQYVANKQADTDD